MADEVATQEVTPTAAEWESWGPEGRDKYLETHPGFTPSGGVAQPGDPVAADINSLDPVDVQPAVPEKLIGTPEAGLQRIRLAISQLSTHSAAIIPGSIIGDAVLLLEEGYNILIEHHRPNDQAPAAA